MKVNIYTDGSYFNDMKVYGWGVLIQDDAGNTLLEDCGGGSNPNLISARNVAGEVLAASRALLWMEQSEDYKQAYLYHDYEGIAKWAHHEWKANKPVSQQYVSITNELLPRLQVRFIHVKGHSGNLGNERADKLAKEGAEKYAKRIQAFHQS